MHHAFLFQRRDDGYFFCWVEPLVLLLPVPVPVAEPLVAEPPVPVEVPPVPAPPVVVPPVALPPVAVPPVVGELIVALLKFLPWMVLPVVLEVPAPPVVVLVAEPPVPLLFAVPAPPVAELVPVPVPLVVLLVFVLVLLFVPVPEVVLGSLVGFEEVPGSRLVVVFASVEGVRFACPGATPPCPGGGLVLRPGAKSRALLLFVSLLFGVSGFRLSLSCSRPGVVERVEPLLPEPEPDVAPEPDDVEPPEEPPVDPL